MRTLAVVGIDEGGLDGLRAEARRAVDVLVGGERHQRLLPEHPAQREVFKCDSAWLAEDVERLLDDGKRVVYRCLADYTRHHRPGGFLPPAICDQEVLSGIGDGTVICLNVSLAGHTTTMTARISEPEPCLMLVVDSEHCAVHLHRPA